MTVTNIASKIPFSDLCRLCEKVSTARKEKKREILKSYIKYFRDYAEKYAKESSQVNTSFYPVMRLLVPQLDRERGAYGVKEHTLAVLYIRILCLPKAGSDAEKLLNYRAPKSGGSQAGDFAEVAYWVLKNKCPLNGHLTVEQVNHYLDNIALKNALNDRRGMEMELTQMLRDMSAFDQKWLIRMLLKDMKLGLGHTRIFNSYHPDAKDLYDVRNNLQEICDILKSPEQRLHELEVQVFSPFRPMLAEQCSVQKIDACFRHHSNFFVETKYDGERFQLHYKNHTFKYFSRNGFEYTDSYGLSPYQGSLTPQLAKQIKENVISFIVDGEMMVWDRRNKFFRSKGENIEVKALKPGGTFLPCFCVFDVLLLNDQVVTNKPLEERYKLLETIFKSEEGVLMITERKLVTSQEEVINELNEAIDNKLEGIMMKQCMTIYKPNSRKDGWYKIKPEYTDGLMDHIDTLIMGGYYGEGRRSGIISHFLVGLAVPNPHGNPVEFHSLTRVGSGYTMTKLEELLSKLNPYWKRVTPGVCPHALQWTREKPDVWIEPQKSFILQIKATEIVESRQNAFKVKHTLRFPRVEDIRYDKKWSDCMTITEFEDLRKQAEGKLYSRHVTSESLEESPSKKKRRIYSGPPKVAQHFSAADLTAVNRTSELFTGREFCVLTGDKNLSKQDIEKKIHETGGTIVQHPGSNTFCVLAKDINIRVSNIVKSQKQNVVKLSWLFRCLDHEQLLSWKPSDMLGCTEELNEEFSLKYDRFGDSFIDFATQQSMEYSFIEVEKAGDFKILEVNEMADMDIELFGDVSPLSFFRLCVAYFDNCSKGEICMDMNLDLAAFDFQFYGGVVLESISEETTHVILHSQNLSRLDEVQKTNHKRQKKFHIVSEKWIQECVEAKKRISERECILSN